MQSDDVKLDEIRKALSQAIVLIRQNKHGRAENFLDEIIDKSNALLTPSEVLEQARSLKSGLQRQKSLQSNRFWLLVVVIVSGLGLTALIENRIGEIDIAVELRVRQVEIEQEQSIRLGRLDIASIEMTGMDFIQIAGTYSFAATDNSIENADSSRTRSDVSEEEEILLQPASRNFSVTALTHGMRLDHINLGKQVNLTSIPVSNNTRDLHISIQSGVTSGEIQVGEEVKLECIGCSMSDLAETDFNLALVPEEALTFSGKKGASVILKGMNGKAETVLAGHFEVDALRFIDPENEINPSTLVQGKIEFPDTTLQAVKLNSSDSFVFQPIGKIEVIQLQSGSHLALRFKCKIRDAFKNSRSILPSWLEWIYRSNALVLYLGALSSLVSFIWLFMKRFELVRS